MLSRRDLLLIAAAGVSASPARAARPPMRDRPLLVTVLTCPRPGGVSYLDGTLAAIDAALPDMQRLIVCDGPAPSTPPGWRAALVPPRAKRPSQLPDNRAPGWVAIWTAFAMGADLLFLEDDIRPLSPGAFKAMSAHVVTAGAAFTSFYHRNRAPGLHDAAAFNMSQAVLLPSATVRRLWGLRDDPTLDAVVGVDLAMAAIGRGERWAFEQTSNLIEHVGHFSAAMPGHEW